MNANVGFISTRLAGTDGVTLEAGKWAEVLEHMGHRCFWFAGEIDRAPSISHLVPEAHFQHEENQWINRQVFGQPHRTPEVTAGIHRCRRMLKSEIQVFIEKFQLDLLVVENALCVPMHIPLGLALTEVISENPLPVIAHHHDFSWERSRFSVNAVGDYLPMAFPPRLPGIEHVVINTEAKEQLAYRTGIASHKIPNVLDFEKAPASNRPRAIEFRQRLGLGPQDRMILQPTRVVRRKGIESAIDLVKQLGDERNVLVITHEAGDEGMEYSQFLAEYAGNQGVDVRMVPYSLSNPWGEAAGNGDEFSLWDIYPEADFVTFPSSYEGFGNAFLEAVYFNKPVLINRYATFIKDIEPLGFDLVVMDRFLSRQNVDLVNTILTDPERRQQMVRTNYAVAREHFSYATLRSSLEFILQSAFRSMPAVPPRLKPERQNIIYLNSALNMERRGARGMEADLSKAGIRRTGSW